MSAHNGVCIVSAVIGRKTISRAENAKHPTRSLLRLIPLLLLLLLWLCCCIQTNRQRLKSFTSKCWHAESATCGEYDDGNEECVWQMEPALLLSGEAECRTAFLALMGTPLQYPCTCTGLNSGEQQRCDAVSNVLHNRSRFSECARVTRRVIRCDL